LSQDLNVRVECWVDPVKGDKPVKEALIKLDDQSFKQIDKLLFMLRQKGVELGMPYSKHLGEGLFELRDARQSGPGYRLYFHWAEPDKIVILLVAGTKKSQPNDIKIARVRKET